MAYGSRFTTTVTASAKTRAGSKPSADSKCKNALALRQASASTKAAAGSKISHTTGQKVDRRAARRYISGIVHVAERWRTTANCAREYRCLVSASA